MQEEAYVMTEAITRTTEELAIELAELKSKEQATYLTEERKNEIRKRIGHISFELRERAKEESQ